MGVFEYRDDWKRWWNFLKDFCDCIALLTVTGKLKCGTILIYSFNAFRARWPLGPSWTNCHFTCNSLKFIQPNRNFIFLSFFSFLFFVSRYGEISSFIDRIFEDLAVYENMILLHCCWPFPIWNHYFLKMYQLFFCFLFSPICFDMIEEAYMTKCGHSFW